MSTQASLKIMRAEDQAKPVFVAGSVRQAGIYTSDRCLRQYCKSVWYRCEDAEIKDGAVFVQCKELQHFDIRINKRKKIEARNTSYSTPNPSVSSMAYVNFFSRLS
jgi:hypothetical protein